MNKQRTWFDLMQMTEDELKDACKLQKGYVFLLKHTRKSIDDCDWRNDMETHIQYCVECNCACDVKDINHLGLCKSCEKDVIDTAKALTLEKEIEKKFCEWIKEKGGMVVKFQDPSQKGAPDRIVFKNGFTYCVEFKKPKGVLAEHQKEYAKKLDRQRVNTYLLDSMDKLGCFKRWIDKSDLLLLNAI